jgi:hypothetical protein
MNRISVGNCNQSIKLFLFSESSVTCCAFRQLLESSVLPNNFSLDLPFQFICISSDLGPVMDMLNHIGNFPSSPKECGPRRLINSDPCDMM